MDLKQERGPSVHAAANLKGHDSTVSDNAVETSWSGFAFNGVQSVFTAYFVTYLVEFGYELGAAGFLFSIVVAVAVPCRVLWAGSAVSTSSPVS